MEALDYRESIHRRRHYTHLSPEHLPKSDGLRACQLELPLSAPVALMLTSLIAVLLIELSAVNAVRTRGYICDAITIHFKSPFEHRVRMPYAGLI